MLNTREANYGKVPGSRKMTGPPLSVHRLHITNGGAMMQARSETAGRASDKPKKKKKRHPFAVPAPKLMLQSYQGSLLFFLSVSLKVSFL
jgi:hypothetical protein